MRGRPFHARSEGQVSCWADGSDVPVCTRQELWLGAVVRPDVPQLGA